MVDYRNRAAFRDVRVCWDALKARDARIAELEAENARLTGKLSLAQGVAGAVQARAALSRTGAVKVKRSDILTKIALWADDEGMELSMGQGDDLAGRILSAPEPAAPEGRQEATDAVLASAVKLAREYRPSMDYDVLHSWAEDAVKVIRVLSDCPAEQAVTDAMVEAACRAYNEHRHGKGCPVWEDEHPPMRAALKAAMEAGR